MLGRRGWGGSNFSFGFRGMFRFSWFFQPELCRIYNCTTKCKQLLTYMSGLVHINGSWGVYFISLFHADSRNDFAYFHWWKFDQYVQKRVWWLLLTKTVNLAKMPWNRQKYPKFICFVLDQFISVCKTTYGSWIYTYLTMRKLKITLQFPHFVIFDSPYYLLVKVVSKQSNKARVCQVRVVDQTFIIYSSSSARCWSKNLKKCKYYNNTGRSLRDLLNIGYLSGCNTLGEPK